MKLSILLKKADPSLSFASVPDRCPHCGSDRYIRYGLYSRGGWGLQRRGGKPGKPGLGPGRIQRYRCKGCRRTFSATTNAFGKRIRLAAQFQVFIASFDRPVPVRVDAKALGVSPTTVWRWRHRILWYLARLAVSERRVLDGKIVIYIRKFTHQRSRWSKHTDIMWRKRGSPLPREMPVLTKDLTFLFAVRFSERSVDEAALDKTNVDEATFDQAVFDEAVDPGALPFFTLAYAGPPTERAIGEMLFPYLAPGARVYGIRDLVGWRTSVREAIKRSPLAGLYRPGMLEAIPPDLECVTWERVNEVEPEFRVSGDTLLEVKPHAARMHARFTRWMTAFRAVRLHYAFLYLEWYYRLECLDASGELPMIFPRTKYYWWWL